MIVKLDVLSQIKITNKLYYKCFYEMWKGTASEIASHLSVVIRSSVIGNRIDTLCAVTESKVSGGDLPRLFFVI